MRISVDPMVHRARQIRFFLFVAAWIWGVAGVVSAAGDHGSLCATATAVTMDEPIAGYHDSATDRDVFKVDAEPGVLALTVFPPSARIEFLGKDCGGPSPRDLYRIERSDARHVLEIRQPGVYFFRVAGRPGLEGEAYTVEPRYRPITAEAEGLVSDSDPPAVCGSDGPRATVPSSHDVVLTEAIDEVDDDILEIESTEPVWIRIEADGEAEVSGSLYTDTRCDSRSQIVSGVPLHRPGGLLLSLEPGTYFLRLAAYLESTGTYGLRIRTLVLPGI